jgi:DNA-directed RNA polymerase sigma subunit (sigma70/sigma32)
MSNGVAGDRGEAFLGSDPPEVRGVERLTWRGRAPDGEERASLRRYLKEISRLPSLDPVDEQALAQRVAEGDEEARRRLVEANLERVLNTAKRYRRLGLPIMELVEEGNIGLLKTP